MSAPVAAKIDNVLAQFVEGLTSSPPRATGVLVEFLSSHLPASSDLKIGIFDSSRDRLALIGSFTKEGHLSVEFQEPPCTPVVVAAMKHGRVALASCPSVAGETEGALRSKRALLAVPSPYISHELVWKRQKGMEGSILQVAFVLLCRRLDITGEHVSFLKSLAWRLGTGALQDLINFHNNIEDVLEDPLFRCIHGGGRNSEPRAARNMYM